MVSNTPYNSSESRSVAPIVCIECGNNAHCMRRSPHNLGPTYEYQAFECISCHRRWYRTVGPASSDQDIQRYAEQMIGKPKRPSPEAA